MAQVSLRAAAIGTFDATNERTQSVNVPECFRDVPATCPQHPSIRSLPFVPFTSTYVYVYVNGPAWIDSSKGRTAAR